MTAAHALNLVGMHLCLLGAMTPIHRSKKRRVEDVDDEHHGEFDANELRQHEEFTKVKNVDSVELGQYQMETWYFSPLPAEYNNCKVRRPPNAAVPDTTHIWKELLALHVPFVCHCFSHVGHWLAWHNRNESGACRRCTLRSTTCHSSRRVAR